MLESGSIVWQRLRVPWLCSLSQPGRHAATAITYRKLFTGTLVFTNTNKAPRVTREANGCFVCTQRPMASLESTGVTWASFVCHTTSASPSHTHTHTHTHNTVLLICKCITCPSPYMDSIRMMKRGKDFCNSNGCTHTTATVKTEKVGGSVW